MKCCARKSCLLASLEQKRAQLRKERNGKMSLKTWTNFKVNKMVVPDRYNLLASRTCDLVRSFYNFYADSDVIFSTPQERFNILQASHPTHVLSVQWSFLTGIRSGLPPACCSDEARRLVDHECSTLIFLRCWGLCAFWVWWFLEWAPETSGADSSQVICRSCLTIWIVDWLKDWPFHCLVE